MLKGILIKSNEEEEHDKNLLAKKTKRQIQDSNVEEFEEIMDKAFSSIINFDNILLVEYYNKLENFKNSKENKNKIQTKVNDTDYDVNQPFMPIVPDKIEPICQYEEDSINLTNQMKDELIKLQQFNSFEKALYNVNLEKNIDNVIKDDDLVRVTNKINKKKDKLIILSNCNKCYGAKLNEYSIISQSDNVYLSYPFNEGSITDFHFVLSTKAHYNSTAGLDENIYLELRNYMKSIVSFNIQKDMSTIFIEYSLHLDKMNHLEVECIPIKHKLLEDARLYFKKAFIDQDYEWTTNKKLVDTTAYRGNLTKILNENFSYVNVDFNAQGGFLHIVEDERRFSQIFLKEILCPLLKKEVHEIKYPKRIGIKELIDTVEIYKKVFKFYDWTMY